MQTRYENVLIQKNMHIKTEKPFFIKIEKKILLCEIFALKQQKFITEMYFNAIKTNI